MGNYTNLILTDFILPIIIGSVGLITIFVMLFNSKKKK